ncbi:MAG: BtrH N-terminal domain-containing protein [Candidatus Thorarchaeota archaeon]|nr:BtrH N-terminal domain-containing protein [Candidatus Thorarchaeota archaeon]
MKYKAIAIMVLVMFVIVPVTTNQSQTKLINNSVVAEDKAKTLQQVPYIWQEINGLCNWAGTAIALQYAGVDVTLHDLLALSGIGFSFSYIRYNDTLLMFPGALYQQIDPVVFVTRLYGLNYSIYFDASVEGIDEQLDYFRSRGIIAEVIDGQQEAFALMRTAIDEGYPLVVSVDPSWLPAADYDFLRDQGLTGGGHAVAIVGYNDSAGVAYIQDPGVGSFGDNYGYPDDGRGNYSQISYTNLNLAWSKRYYISILIKRGGEEPTSTISDQLGPYIRDRLLGAGESYAPGAASAYIWQFGEKGFRGLAKDVTPEGLKSFLAVFDGMQNERQYKASILTFLGLAIESSVTLQYLSYKVSLTSLHKYLTGHDFSEFYEAAESALPHFAALSDNSSLLYVGNISRIVGDVHETFSSIAKEYNATGDLDSAIANHSTGLVSIAEHLTGIADSWSDAGNALTKYWPYSPLVLYGPLIMVSIAVAGVATIGTFLYVRRRRSQ